MGRRPYRTWRWTPATPTSAAAAPTLFIWSVLGEQRPPRHDHPDQLGFGECGPGGHVRVADQGLDLVQPAVRRILQCRGPHNDPSASSAR